MKALIAVQDHHEAFFAPVDFGRDAVENILEPLPGFYEESSLDSSHTIRQGIWVVRCG